MLKEHATSDSPVHRLDARLKAVVALAFVVVVVSTPAPAYHAFAGYASVLLAVLILSRVPAGFVLVRLAAVLPFVGAVALFIPFLPSDGADGYSLGCGAQGLPRGGMVLFWSILAKSLLGTLAAILLTATTPVPKLLHALGQLGMPRVLTLTANFTYRYIFVLVDEAQRMMRARDSRCYAGRWLWQARVIGQMIGVLFLRSYERGERVYMAMLARGYDGHATAAEVRKPATREWACAGAACAVLVVLRLCAL